MRGVEGMEGGNGEWEKHYQFLATIGFPRIFSFLDFGLCLILCSEDRFFFFWSSRPIFCFFRRVSREWMSSVNPWRYQYGE